VVGVLEEDGQLVIGALDSGEVLAHHPLACGKGEVFKNTHHYRDRTQQIAALEAALVTLLGAPLGARLCALLKATSPAIYKDPLRGAQTVLAAQQPLRLHSDAGRNAGPQHINILDPGPLPSAGPLSAAHHRMTRDAVIERLLG